MLKFICSLFFLSCHLAAFSQISFGFRTGVYIPKWDAKSESRDINAFMQKKMNLEIAAISEIPLKNKMISLQPEMGILEKDVQLRYDEIVGAGFAYEKLKLFTLESTLLLKAQVLRRTLKFNILLGPTINYAFIGKKYYKANSRWGGSYSEITTPDFKTEFKRMHYGYQIGASIGADVEGVHMFLDGRFANSVSNIGRLEDKRYIPKGFLVTGGLLFKFKHK